MTSKNRIPSITLEDLYGNYLNSHPEGSEYYLNKHDFKKASKYIFNNIVEDIFKGKRYKLPHNLGTLYLDKFKLKGKKVDFGTSNKIGKVVYYTNLHSDGLTYKLKWFKVSTNFKYKKLYKFKLNRNHSRHLSSLIKQNKIKIFKYYG